MFTVMCFQGQNMRMQHCRVGFRPQREWKGLAVTQLKAHFHQVTHFSSKCMEITVKNPKWCMYIYQSSVDTVLRLGKGTVLLRHCNYIIGQLLLSYILIQILEASPTPLIPWDLSLLLHDKCIWTQSTCNGYLLQEMYRPGVRQMKGAHTLSCRRMILCVCAREIENIYKNVLQQTL